MSQDSQKKKSFAETNMSLDPNQAMSIEQDPKKLLLNLISTKYGPSNAVVAQQALKHQDNQIKEAMSQGMGLEDILQSKGVHVGGLNDNPQLLKPTSMFQQAQVTPEGNIQEGGAVGTFFGQSSNNLLSKLLDLSKIQKAPLEMQQEQRLQNQEQRRLRQEQAYNLQKFGGRVSESEIADVNQSGADVSSIIEAYGIPAQVDNKTGERFYNIPNQSILTSKAQQQKISDGEIDHLTDLSNVIKETTDIVGQLKKLGINDPSEVGELKVDEGFFSGAGPLSLPARFNLVGQYAKDPKYTAVKQRVERLFQIYRKAVTGAQASNTELQALRPLMLSLTQRPGVFFQMANDIQNESNMLIGNRLNLMEGAGRDVSGLRKNLGVSSSQEPTQSQSNLSDEQAYQEYINMNGGK